MPDHLHLCLEVHPTLALSEFVQVVKQESSRWLILTRIIRFFQPLRGRFQQSHPEPDSGSPPCHCGLAIVIAGFPAISFRKRSRLVGRHDKEKRDPGSEPGMTLGARDDDMNG